MNIELENVLE